MKVKFLPLTEVVVPEDRQRKGVPEKHIAELVASIKLDGLINPLVVDQNDVLVAGDCRRRALTLLAEAGEEFYFAGVPVPLGQAPVTVTHQTDEVALFRIELEENIRRQDLDPIDRAAAIAKLHEIRISENPLHTQKDTALELADIENTSSVSYKEREVADSLILSQFQNDPDVRKAKTKGEAIKLAKVKLQNDFMAALGAENGDYLDGDRESRHSIITGDCCDVMLGMEDSSFDGIVCDPPYGVGADSFGEQSFSAGHGYEDSAERALDIAKHILTSGTRILRESAGVYLFCDIRRWAELADLARGLSYYVWPVPIIWSKGSTGHCPRPGFGPKRTYEAILFATRGDKATHKTGNDVISCSPVRNKVHAAEKPVDLLAEILSWSFSPGDHILDPCAGSGSIIPAAHRLGIKTTCIEVDPAFADICRHRTNDNEDEDNGSASLVDLTELFSN